MEEEDKFGGLKKYLLMQGTAIFVLCFVFFGNAPSINMVTCLLISISTALISVFLFIVYFAPTIIAVDNDNPQSQGIMVLNLFLGWTLFGWVVSFVWAVIRPKVQDQYNQSSAASFHKKNLNIIRELTLLDELKSKGSISEDEYLTLKKRIINPTI